jgi:hypothetical protein
MGHLTQTEPRATVRWPGNMQREQAVMMLPDCFADESIMFVHATHEIYDGCRTPVKTGNVFVTGFCSDPSQTENSRRSQVIDRSLDR